MMIMASSMLMYCKEKGSAGIPSLTLEPAGLDTWYIKRSLPFFFGTAPMPEQYINGNGGGSNGPAV